MFRVRQRYLQILTLFVASIFAILSIQSRALAQTTPDFEKRLDRLVDKLEESRELYHIPGMSLAVVYHGEVARLHGFGLADRKAGTPATADTIFAIGSSTKAFTATLVGMLCDAGKMAWDDPVTKFLPYFTLSIDSDDEKAFVTLRDLLCHRTGFTRMSLLWVGGGTDRKSMLGTAAHAEPWARFRERFIYNNVMFIAAGMAAAEAGGTGWDELLERRLFKPLGMDSSSTSLATLDGNPRQAKGYFYDEEIDDYKDRPMRFIDTAGPCGGITSTARDMAQWLRLQLGCGVFEGQRLISESTLRETWTQQMAIAEGAGYGLGWMLFEHEGRTIITHGGNIDGFAAQVAFLPESELGFALLSNTSFSPLQQMSLQLVFETLLGERDESEDEAGSADGEEVEKDPFAPYLGEYEANFGNLKDTILTVQVQNENLAIDIPGQMVYELQDPDSEGLRHFVITQEIAISFDRNDSGEVYQLKLHQGGLVFEAPRKGVEITPEVPLEELRQYLGRYESELFTDDVEVLIQNNRLAADVPGQMVYEFDKPDADGRWSLRVMKTASVSFERDDNGRITALVLHQGGQDFRMPRIDDSDAGQLPTVAELLALRQVEQCKSALEKAGVIRMQGTVKMLQSGLEGQLVWFTRGKDRFREDIELGEFGWIRRILNGDRAVVISSFQPLEELYGRFVEQEQKMHPGVLLLDWRHAFEKITVLNESTQDERKVYKVKLAGGRTPPMRLVLDAETGDVLEAEIQMLMPGIGPMPQTITFEQYRSIAGLRLPTRITISNDWDGRSVIEIHSIKSHAEAAEELFCLEESR